MIYNLRTIYTTRESFYGKAQVEEYYSKQGRISKLYSYNTHVATIVYTDNFKYFYITHNTNHLTNTTIRHIKEFMLQEGLQYTNKQTLLKTYKDIKEMEEI